MDYVLNLRPAAPSCARLHAAQAAHAQRRRTRVLAQAVAIAVSFVRMLAALVVATFFAPLVAPALLTLLPGCWLVRLLERAATRAITAITAIAGVRAVIGAKCDARNYRASAWKWLAPPIVRAWESPLLRGHFVATYDQPGRWMTDSQLGRLHDMLVDVAGASMDAIPAHRLFDRNALRDVLSNRIISVAHDTDGTPLGFTALVYLPYGADFIVHLGLTMIRESARGQRIQSPLFTKCLSLVALNHCRFSYPITNIAASPAGIGSVADYFLDTYPHYDGSTPQQPFHVGIARHVLRYYKHEFGCSANARFDENTFVVYGSNEEMGGGASAFIKEDGKPVSRHKNPACNDFVKRNLDLTAGDELFQVGRVHLLATFVKYLCGKKKVNRRAQRKA